jgi:hypothetical protein
MPVAATHASIKSPPPVWFVHRLFLVLAASPCAVAIETGRYLVARKKCPQTDDY